MSTLLGLHEFWSCQCPDLKKLGRIRISRLESDTRHHFRAKQHQSWKNDVLGRVLHLPPMGVIEYFVFSKVALIHSFFIRTTFSDESQFLYLLQ